MRIILLFVLTIFTGSAFAQLPRYYEQERSNQGGVLPVTFTYGIHVPGGDLADRFGSHFSAGGMVEYLTAKDYILGAHSHFIFGSNVNEDVLAELANDDGLIFGADGSIAEVPLRQRGIYIGGHIGRIFRLQKTQRSGIRATIGAGLYQHKIRIQDDPVVVVPYLSKEYKKGYDRLTNGIALTQFIGYQHLGRSRRLNFVVGFEFGQAFTQNRRTLNFDTREQDTDERLDLSFGVKIGWTLPFYINENADELEY